jgi:transcriptional regulator with GAF, ATPase, and Fis domain
VRELEAVAPTEATVLIRGETGTGKELVARMIHRLSRRRLRPLVTVHAAALSPALVESELFGHEKGAFTGAAERRIGHVEAAEGGTLFLDEIGELSGELQVKLLRLLQEREFSRVGGSRTRRSDVRLIAATNRDLEAALAAGRLREDFYYRLNVFPLKLPPLRERIDDIEPLVRHFVARFSANVGKHFDHIDRAALARCREYGWPGNVRELENLVARAVILCPPPLFTMNPQAQAEASAPGGGLDTLRAIVRAHIVRALKASRGKIYGADGAARLLGLKPSTLQAKLKRLGIDRHALRQDPCP